ncbi:hypothetical protein V8G54_016044 [Vigna mungo]|uniref:GDSL esterase/lipase n=1 Tax=Vigna mungo TaxID=3915 RepID=A0AAQ3RXF4_VIGMU
MDAGLTKQQPLLAPLNNMSSLSLASPRSIPRQLSRPNLPTPRRGVIAGARGTNKERFLASFQWEGHMEESNIHWNESNLGMCDLLGSFPGKCAGEDKWYQSLPVRGSWWTCDTQALTRAMSDRRNLGMGDLKHIGKPRVDVWGQSIFPRRLCISIWMVCVAARIRKRIVPALYVFGDSTVDAGNNNNLNTFAKANAFPYGIDFNNCSTGRFSNGKTFADLIAIRLGLPMPPPYLGVPKFERHQIVTGINYASGSCGILNSTRSDQHLVVIVMLRSSVRLVPSGHKRMLLDSTVDAKIFRIRVEISYSKDFNCMGRYYQRHPDAQVNDFAGDVKESDSDVKFFYDGQGFMSVQMTETEAMFSFYNAFGDRIHHSRVTKPTMHPVS